MGVFFNKDFTKLESYFKIEILVQSCFPHERSINRLKKGCHFGVNFLLKTRAYLTELKRATANRMLVFDEKAKPQETKSTHM